MSDTLTIPADGLRRLKETGEVTVLLPIDKSQIPHRSDEWIIDHLMRGTCAMCGGCGEINPAGDYLRCSCCDGEGCEPTSIPFKTGDKLDVLKEFSPAEKASGAVTREFHRVTVLSCSAVKVAEMTESDWRDCGRVNPDTDNWPDGNMYAWAVKLQRERSE